MEYGDDEFNRLAIAFEAFGRAADELFRDGCDMVGFLDALETGHPNPNRVVLAQLRAMLPLFDEIQRDREARFAGEQFDDA